MIKKILVYLGILGLFVVLSATVYNGAITVLGPIDFSGATTTKPMKTGTSDPGTCSEGEYLFRTDTNETKACTATNTWTALGGGSGALTLLEQHTASASSSLDFTTAITSTYDEYLIEFVGIVPATDAVEMQLRMSTNGGSSYDSGANYSDTGFAITLTGTATTGATGATEISLNSSTGNTSG